MSELNLRVSVELYERLDAACVAHGLSMGDFCRRSARQFYSGRIKAVTQSKLLECSTYKGKFAKSRKWDFEIKGKELTAVLVSALIKLEGIKAIKAPDVKEVEGVHYNVPEMVLMQEFKEGKI